MNKVFLMGRLTADPEMRYTQDHKAVANYTLAVDRWTNDNKTDFLRCVAWEKRGEFAEKYLRKGMKILVTGRIQIESYTDRDGKRVYTTDIVVDEQEFAESKNAEQKQVQEKAEDKYMNIPENIGEESPFN